MSIKTVDQDRLDALHAKYGHQFGGRKEDYFALLYLTRKFKVDVEEVSHQVAFGGNDYGIDAYFFDRDARNLYLYQFKWTENPAQFRGSMERLAKDGLQRIFGGSQTQDSTQNDLLSYLKKDLKEHMELMDRVYVHFVFKGDVDAADNSEGLSNRREDIENKVHLVAKFFSPRAVELLVDFIADKPGQKGPPPKQSYEIHLRRAGTSTHEGRTMYVGFIPLMDLYGIYRALGQGFFDRNIRAALPPDNPPNKKLREALDRIVIKELDEPSIFVFRHNGVTLAAEKVVVSDDERATLHVPRLLNGAQTVSSLNRFLENQADNPLLRKNQDRLSGIMVLAKIIEDDPSGEFVTQVTISNNQQNPVPPWALRAMDQRQVHLADKFRDELGIFYSRQEGSFESLSDEEREELGVADKDIRIRPLAQTFLAIQGDVYNMSRLSDVFESQKLYTETFKNSYINANARTILLVYKVGLMMPRTMARLSECMPQKYQGALPKARNLCWAILVQAVLNDKRLADYEDAYGGNPVKESALGEVLKSLAGQRVAPIMKELLGSSFYSGKVANERYDFLRTTEAFRRAMAIGIERYSWSRRSF